MVSGEWAMNIKGELLVLIKENSSSLEYNNAQTKII